MMIHDYTLCSLFRLQKLLKCKKVQFAKGKTHACANKHMLQEHTKYGPAVLIPETEATH
jgi:hypothetical protein